MRTRHLRLLGFGLAVVALGSCAASTRFTDIWKDPATNTLAFKKVAAVAITADQTMRRVAEEEMVAMIKQKREAVASYTIIDPAMSKDVEASLSKIKEVGCDGVVTMRVVGVDEKTTYVPGSYVSTTAYPPPYYSFGGYYGYAMPTVYEPGYNMTNKYVMVETNIYRLSDDKLIWSGRSETVDPQSAGDLVRSIGKEAGLVINRTFNAK